MPGLVSLATIVFCIVTAVFAPRFIITAAALTAAYSALRFAISAIANLRGLRRIKLAEATDWRARYQQAAGEGALAWDAVQHVVIIPNYGEPETVLCKTLDNIARMSQAREAITIVLAMEARESGANVKGSALQKRYATQFVNIFYTIHPVDLPNETQCKSANLAWATQWVQLELVDYHDYRADHMAVTVMDADTLWHERYFEALTYSFAIDENRYRRFWQAPARFHSNIYEINALIRLVNVYATAFELAYLSAKWWQSLPMSSYSLSFRLLDSCDFYDTDVIADEWRMSIKAFFAQDLDVWLEPIYLPFLATSVTGDTFWQLCKNRYQQSLRHAWGSKEISYTIGQTLKSGQFRSLRALRLLFSVSHDILLSGAASIVVAVGAYLPMILYPDLLRQYATRAWEFPPFLLLQIAFTVTGILSVLFWHLDVRSRPARVGQPTVFERFLTVLSFVALPVLALVFVTIPVLQAQLWLMMGKALPFKVTSKV
jgi:hypothetical protein